MTPCTRAGTGARHSARVVVVIFVALTPPPPSPPPSPETSASLAFSFIDSGKPSSRRCRPQIATTAEEPAPCPPPHGFFSLPFSLDRNPTRRSDRPKPRRDRRSARSWSSTVKWSPSLSSDRAACGAQPDSTRNALAPLVVSIPNVPAVPSASSREVRWRPEGARWVRGQDGAAGMATMQRWVLGEEGCQRIVLVTLGPAAPAGLSVGGACM